MSLMVAWPMAFVVGADLVAPGTTLTPSSPNASTNLDRSSLGAPSQTKDLTKLTIFKPWRDVTVRLLPPPNPSKAKATGGDFISVPARQAIFQISPAPANYNGPFASVEILAIDDPYSHRTFLIRAGENLSYFSNLSDLTAFLFDIPGFFSAKSFMEMPSGLGSMNTLTAKFEAVGAQGVNDDFIPDFKRVEAGLALPNAYFEMSSNDAKAQPKDYSTLIPPRLESAGWSADGLFQIGIRNPSTNVPVTLWIDLKRDAVVKATMDGKEMELGSRGRPYAIPKPQ